MAFNSTPKMVILDTDAGVDDAIALMQLFYFQDKLNFDLLAVTCVIGNTEVENVYRNVLITIDRCTNVKGIKVYKGCTRSLQNRQIMEYFYDKDGLCGQSSDFNCPEVKMETEHAAKVIISLARKHPGQIDIIMLGPLTNLAVARMLDDEVLNLFRNIWILGGTLHGSGNVTAMAEFNFHFDPEAVDIILNSSNSPIRIFPVEVCRQHAIKWNFYRDLMEINNRKVNFFKKITNKLYKRGMSCFEGENGFVPCDFYLILAIFKPEIVLEMREWHASVELTGERTRGHLVLDKRIFREGEEKSGKIVKVITQLDDRLVNKLFEDALRH